MIKNITRGTIISRKKNFAENFFSKSIGLMFSKKEFIPLIFIFEKERTVPLHMFFVFFPIDVLFLNKEKTVVEVKESFMPFTAYKPKNRAQYVIELPEYSVKKTKTEAGDKIGFL